MTEQYVPTTEQVRLDYVMAYSERESSQLLAEAGFDRWLAKRDAEVAAKAWDEGASAMRDIYGDVVEENPYREAVQS